MEIKYIRLAHELGVGCGDPCDIEIVGDEAAAEANWEQLAPDKRGFATVGDESAELKRTGMRALWQSFGILGTTIKEAPEFAARRRRSAH